jgi:hypothetical protein
MKQKATIPLLLLMVLWNVSCNTEKETNDTWTLEEAPPPKLASKERAVMINNIIKVSAQQLSADYIANEIKADNDYKGKELIVTGKIQEITRGIAGNIYIVLTGSNRMRTVFCYFDNEEKAAVLKKGQVVSFKGSCEGLMVSVIVNNCRLIED